MSLLKVSLLPPLILYRPLYDSKPDMHLGDLYTFQSPFLSLVLRTGWTSGIISEVVIAVVLLVVSGGRSSSSKIEWLHMDIYSDKNFAGTGNKI